MEFRCITQPHSLRALCVCCSASTLFQPLCRFACLLPPSYSDHRAVRRTATFALRHMLHQSHTCMCAMQCLDTPMVRSTMTLLLEKTKTSVFCVRGLKIVPLPTAASPIDSRKTILRTSCTIFTHCKPAIPVQHLCGHHTLCQSVVPWMQKLDLYKSPCYVGTLLRAMTTSLVVCVVDIPRAQSAVFKPPPWVSTFIPDLHQISGGPRNKGVAGCRGG